MKRKRISLCQIVEVAHDGELCESVVVYKSGELCTVLHLRTLNETHHPISDLRPSTWRRAIKEGDVVWFYVEYKWYASHVISRIGDDILLQPWGTRFQHLTNIESFRILRHGGSLPDPFCKTDEPFMYAKVCVSHPVESGYIVDTYGGMYVMRTLGGYSRLVAHSQICSATKREPLELKYIGTVLREHRYANLLWACKGCDDDFLIRLIDGFRIFDIHNTERKWCIPRTSYLLKKQLDEILPAALHVGGVTSDEVVDAHTHIDLYAKAFELQTKLREGRYLEFRVQDVRGGKVVISVYRRNKESYLYSSNKQLYYFPLFCEISGKLYPEASTPWAPTKCDKYPRLTSYQTSALKQIQRRERRQLSLSHSLGGDYNPFTGFQEARFKTYGGVLIMPPYGKTRIMVANMDTKKTLVLCQPSAYDTWCDELAHCKVSWGMFYDGFTDVKQTVILSTYLRWKNSNLLRSLNFQRVIYDDADTIPLKSNLFLKLMDLTTPVRWCLTRDASKKELYLNLLGVCPFYNYVPSYACDRVEKHIERLCENRIWLHVKKKDIFSEIRRSLIVRNNIFSTVINTKMHDYLRTNCQKEVLCFPREVPLSCWALSETYTTIKDARSNLQYTNSLENLEDNCTICMDPYQRPAVLGCGHVFCFDCIDTQRKYKKECPICRKKIGSLHILCSKVSKDISHVTIGSSIMSFPTWVWENIDTPITDRLARVEKIINQAKGSVLFYTNSMHMARHVPGDIVHNHQPSKYRRRSMRMFQRGEIKILSVLANVKLSGVSLTKAKHVIICGAGVDIMTAVNRIGANKTIYLHNII